MPQNKYKIFDKMIEGIQIVNRDWQYVYVNDTVVEHSKYSRKELLGYTMMEKYPGIETTAMFRCLETCMNEGVSQVLLNEFDFPDGSKGYFELRVQEIDEGILVLSIDVSQQKQAEQILLQNNAMLDEKVKERTAELIGKNKELEQFAYIASHDLQEPLRTVSNYIEIFKEDYGETLDATAMGYLDSVDRAMKRMSTLSKALLDFSRLGKNTEIVSVDCNQIVADVLSDLENVIQKTATAVTYNDMPVLKGYEVELRQLFQNLISNAIKFRNAEVKPKIHIHASETATHWQFKITDNGIGIESKYFERIFQIFQRLHTKEKYEGSGIGLANCKKIVELHKGAITLESELNKGSTFIFTISKQLRNE